MRPGRERERERKEEEEEKSGGKKRVGGKEGNRERERRDRNGRF